MYKHIIETMVTDMNIQFENGIVKAVQDVGVIVDKEELVKALMYDRNQYEEGYRDGKKDSFEWIPVSERLPKECEHIFCTFQNSEGERFVVEDNCYPSFMEELYDGMIAWMPFCIEPYKGE